MALNDQQRAIVEALGGTVNVMAGAGTGKTFTLTQRIVAAIEDAIGRGEESPISRIMAITFTEAAAAELKSRVRSALFDEAKGADGTRARGLLEAALNVDSSWISTIHSMAGRILRENAIEFGIDPDFEVSDEESSNALREQSFEEAIAFPQAGQDATIELLIEREPTYSPFPSSSSIFDKAMALLGDVETMPGSLGGVELPNALPDLAEMLKGLIMVGVLAREHMLEDDWSAGDAVKGSEYAEQIEAATEFARDVASRIEGIDPMDDGFPLDELVTAVHMFPPTTNKFGARKEAHAQVMADYREAYRKASDEVSAVCGLRRTIGLVKVAERVEGIATRNKVANASSFEHGEILRRCLEELEDPGHAQILERYRDQFDFIMVDEFQDTDKLQLRIIKLLSREMPDGLGTGSTGDDGAPSRLGNVCTVGDMQQSIYRFRGGDVEESVKRAESLKDVEGSRFELSCNYRSHADILDAVEVVFSQTSVFGDEFLSLSAARDRDDAQSLEFFASKPRIEFDFVHATKKKADQTEGVSRAEAVAAIAMDIAARFRALADAGIPQSKMAVLLGKMSNASIFSAALRAVGIESVITGGSVFSDMPEALLAESLLRFAENPADEVAMVQCLASPLFAVADDALLAMATKEEDGFLSRMRISDSFRAACDGAQRILGQLSPDVGRALRSACNLLATFARDSASSPSRAMRDLLAESGYLMRLQDEGTAEALAAAGNIAKAIRIVEGLEQRATGKGGISRAYSDHLANAKETPGMLSTTDADFVRIMTVHKSKGLEFDHVAVAELRDGVDPSSAFVIENIDDSTYIAQAAIERDFEDPQGWDNRKKLLGFDHESEALDGIADAAKSERAKAIKELVRTSTTPAARLEALAEHRKLQELEEARRLLYVAMTRARESLIVANAFSSTLRQGTYRGIFEDVIQALAAHYGKPQEEFSEDLSISSSLIAFDRKTLVRESLDAPTLQAIEELAGARVTSSDDQEDAQSAASLFDGITTDASKFVVPVYSQAPQVELECFQYNWRDMESYSSISAASPEHAGAMPDDANAPFEEDGVASFEDDAASRPDAVEVPEDPTGLGTAFHRIMQLSIEEAVFRGTTQVEPPTKEALSAQLLQADLSKSQEDRLLKALGLMFGSQILARFSAHGQIGAEVPFCTDMGEFFLQGEIDALADDGKGHAMLLDYKTGYLGMHDEGEMRRAHSTQATCYAYALMAAGFEQVDAYFVHVEMPDQQDPSDPVFVKYSFGKDAEQGLCDAIRAARVYA